MDWICLHYYDDTLRQILLTLITKEILDQFSDGGDIPCLFLAFNAIYLE